MGMNVRPEWSVRPISHDLTDRKVEEGMDQGLPHRPRREEWAWNRALAFVLLLGLGVGVVLGNDSGASTDEVREVEAAQASVAAYSVQDVAYNYDPRGLIEHGPAYLMLWSSAGQVIHKLADHWTQSDGRHLFNFTAFLVGAALFYPLSRKFLMPRSAFLATLLFAAQPVLFGYGFINQKDIPFMVLFMAVVLAGVSAADRLHGIGLRELQGDEWEPPKKDRGPGIAIANDWRALGRGGQIALGVAAVGLAGLLASLIGKGWVYGWGESLLREAYAGQSPGLTQELFSRIATDAYKTPLELYLAKYDEAFKLVRVVAAAAVGVALVVGGGRAFPSLRARLQAAGSRGYLFLLLAGTLLGVAVCVRQIGLFAGALISAYILYRLKRKALPVLLVYWSVAILVMYGTWPYLWPDPIGRFLESLEAVTFTHTVDVLYRGKVFDAGKLPWHYIPTLMAVQLTEPAVLLGLVGLPIVIARMKSNKIPRALTALYGAWVAVPLGAVILLKAAVYDNLRHVLFVLPPLFVMSGMALDSLLALIRPRWAKAMVSSAILLPGILGIIGMHPYEYSYFNSITGGVSGAYTRYDVDHWCTSLREAVAVVNEQGKNGARVYVGSLVNNARPFQRKDLQLGGFDSATADFVLACRPTLAVDWESMGFSLVYQVGRGEAVFAQVWERNQGDDSGGN